MSTTYTPDGQTKHTSVTLPQDVINDVVVGTVNPPFQRLADNCAWLLLQADNIRNVANFGATGDGSTDDLVALDDAEAELAAAGGGTLLLGAGRFRITNKFQFSASVSLMGIPGLTTIVIDSPTAACVERKTGGADTQSNYIYGINIEADQTDTGAAIEVNGLSGLQIVRCGVNTEDTKLTGYVLNVSAGAPIVQIESKLVSAKTDPAAAFACSRWDVFGGEIVMAPAASADLINCTDFSGFGTLFSQVSTGAGGFAFFNAANAWAVKLNGCKFDVDDSGAGAGTYAIDLHTGATVITSGNDFRTVGLYKYTSGPLTDDSDLQLIPSYSQATIHGTTITLADGYGSAYFSSDNGTEPTVTLPRILFIGQVFQAVIRNVSGGPWAGSVLFGGQGSNDVYVQGTGLDGVTNFLSLGWVAVFKADESRYAWVQQGLAVQV